MVKDLLRQYRFLNLELNALQGVIANESDPKRREAWERVRDERQQQIETADVYINSIDDSLIRQLVIYRYKHGLKWQEIATRMGSDYTEDGLRKRLERFLKKF